MSQPESREDNVKVMVRCRPFNQREGAEGAYDVIKIDKALGNVIIKQPNKRGLTGKQEESLERAFTFDAAYGQQSTQIEIFDETVAPMIEKVLVGYNSTIFAYGQTGSGKTHTMMGYKGDLGMIPQSIQKMFDHISQADVKFTYLVRCSFYEIYNETIRDLMAGTGNLQVKETAQKGVWIDSLSEYHVNNEQEIGELMEKGNKHRSTAATSMNATSSRSHSIFLIILERLEDRGDGKEHIVQGKLNLVDLAGSERADKTGATGERLQEGVKINLSLSSLGLIIEKLVEGAEQSSIPYRNSKLTHLLKDGLGGNSKTLMVVAISPASTNAEETLSSLRYADRAKHIKNKAKINEDPKDAQIRQMKKQIEDLEAQLAIYLGNGGVMMDGEQVDVQQLEEEIERIQIKKKVVVVKNKLTPEELAKQEQEQQKLEIALQKKKEKALKARKFVEEITQQIQGQKDALVSKKNLENEVQEKERQLRIARQELAQQKQASADLKKQIQEQDAEKENELNQVMSVQEQIQVLKRKLDKYKGKKAEMKQNLKNMQSDFAAQKLEKQDEINQYRLLDERAAAQLDYFVPEALVPKLMAMVVEKDGETMLLHDDQVGNAQIYNRKKGYE